MNLDKTVTDWRKALMEWSEAGRLYSRDMKEYPRTPSKIEEEDREFTEAGLRFHQLDGQLVNFSTTRPGSVDH